MNCPTCQLEMIERVSALECPDDSCPQIPICKGCFQPQTFCGAGINEYFCDNDDCPRTPEENLRDLMNPALHRYRILDFTNGENQETIKAWVEESFPEWCGPKHRALAIVEEAVELATIAGLSRDEVQSAVNLSFTKFEARAAAGEEPESDEGELGDIYINVLAYAAERGLDARAALNKKMKKNRSRPTSHYLAKTEEKKKLGLKLC